MKAVIKIYSHTNVDFNEAKDGGVAVASAGPYACHLHLLFCKSQQLKHGQKTA